MNFSEHLFIIKNKIFRKNNILFIFVMIILLFAMFTSLSIMSLYVSNENAKTNKSINARKIYVYPSIKERMLTSEDLDKINNIKHVSFVGSKLFSDIIEVYVDELNKPFSSASIILHPLLDGIYIKNAKGNENINKGEMLCPVNFYPYEVNDYNATKPEDSDETDEVFAMKKKIVKSAKIKDTDLIGKTLNVKYISDYNYDREIGEEINIEYDYKDFKVVGTYNENYTMNSLNDCYISKDDFLELSLVQSAFENPKRVEQYEKQEYGGIMIIIDDYKNIGYVHQELDKLNYVYEDQYEVIRADKLFFTYAPMFITIIILIVAINIIYNFNSKKIKGRVKNYALLKSLGYDNKTIEINEILENVICYLISFVISLILFISFFVVVKNNYLASYIVEGYLINIPILAIISIFVVVLCLIIIINNKLVAKKLNKSVLELVRNEI